MTRATAKRTWGGMCDSSEPKQNLVDKPTPLVTQVTQEYNSNMKQMVQNVLHYTGLNCGRLVITVMDFRSLWRQEISWPTKKQINLSWKFCYFELKWLITAPKKIPDSKPLLNQEQLPYEDAAGWVASCAEGRNRIHYGRWREASAALFRVQTENCALPASHPMGNAGTFGDTDDWRNL